MKAWLERRVLLGAVVVLLSIVAHLKGLGAPLLDYHHHRQVNTASIARNYYRESRPLWRPRVDWEGPEDRMAATELPVQMWLYGKLWPVFGLGEGWGRVLSAACSALTALLLFALFRRELGTEAGFYGACLFSMVPLEVYFGRTVQPEAMALLGLVSAVYFWELSLSPGRRWLPWAAAVLGAVVACGLKLPYAHLFIPLAALTWRRLGRGALVDWRTWLAGFACAGLVGAWYKWASAGVYVVPTHGSEFWKILGYARLPYFTQHLLLSRFPEITATYAGVVMFWFGARERLVERRDAFWIAFFAAPLVHLIALGDYAYSHDYTALPLVPATAGLMGLGLALLRAKASAQAEPARRAAALAGVALLLFAVPAHTSLRISHWYGQTHPHLARAGEAAAAVSRPEDPFVANSRGPSVALYYLDRRGWGFAFDGYGAARLIQLVEEKRKQGARFVASEKRGHMAEDGALWKELRRSGKPVWDDGSFAIFRLPPLKGRSAVRPSPSAPAAR